jgi:hypothetical protein
MHIRYTFIGIILTLAMALSAWTCPSQNTIAALIKVVGTACSSIATLDGNTAAAQAILDYSNDASNAVQAWQKGSPSKDAVEALNILSGFINSTFQGSKYLILANIAIAAINQILSQLPASAGVPSKWTVDMSNPPKNADEFKAQWNAIIATHPELAAAQI